MLYVCGKCGNTFESEDMPPAVVCDKCGATMTRMFEAFVLFARQPYPDGEIYTEECLRKAAENDDRLTYDEDQKCLKFKGEVK